MSASSTCLAVIAAIVAAGAVVGSLAGIRRKVDLQQWTVGGRGFGAVLVFLLMAGETYTTFAFLGASGWAYSRGGPALYVLAYLTLAYAGVVLPPAAVVAVRQVSRAEDQSDFFGVRYGSKYLAAFVCVVGIVCFIPYVDLQITRCSGSARDFWPCA